MAFETSTRRARLPASWPELRAKTKARAKGRCEATIHDPKCNGIGTDCDHVRPGDDHALENLQWLSRACHDAKTKTENAQANTDRAALRRRPQEPHPGRLQ